MPAAVAAERERRVAAKLQYNREQRLTRFIPGYVDERAMDGSDWWLDLDLGLSGEGTHWRSWSGDWFRCGIPHPRPPPPPPEKRLWL